ncbi:hypothetical protein LG634_12650 [Streptomyces bambusae]|uniref:proline dehydrogenase family protein n=1 Tax=Streptomyces bambusae TaxID=1550616 RepID=UPI001CFCFCF9|nr:proline dehydrogenase family protein [Streptomyces bambusae]MCB5165681.1 hypothetical protein [Streptomyces bambusae]
MTTVHGSSQRALLEAAAEGLRRLATDSRCLAGFAAPDSPLRDVLSPAARRYVLAPDREGFLAESARLRALGYRVTAEFTGSGPEEEVVGEYLALLGHEDAPDQVGFDLLAVGLGHSPARARENAGRVAAAAAERGGEIVLSMERYATVDAALTVQRELSRRYGNVGLTLQAHLHRTERDAAEVARPGCRIRLVKGAFPEPAHRALGRGPALDDRYLRLAQLLVERGVRLSLATQDPAVLAAAEDSGLLASVAEIEMRYGVQPGLLRTHHEAGRPCRINATYGTNWWLHLLQRLTEHPPMVLDALADIGTTHPTSPY